MDSSSAPDTFIDLCDVPQALLDEIRERLWWHTASLFTIEAPHAYGGTCTLVSLGGVPHVLTAAHVWAQFRSQGFAISVDEGVQLHPLHKQVVEPVAVFDPDGVSEWGPDLALIRMPEVDASWLRVRKAFYNLDRRGPANRDESAPRTMGLWVVIGGVGEQSSFTTREALLGMRVYAAACPDVVEKDKFDYVDLPFDRGGRPTLPQFFGGISGSGLWHVKLLKARASGEISIGSVHLEGVAFRQVAASERTGFIRCHGRQSLHSRLVPKATR